MTRSYTRGANHVAWAKSKSQRAAKWRELYLAGQTLQQIGDAEGVTREYVRQVLTACFGRIASQGGASVIALKKKVERQATADAKSIRLRGCTVDQYQMLRSLTRQMKKGGCSHGVTPLGAYNNQIRNARFRKIEWNFKLWTWWQVWQQSGKWEQRGRSGDAYVMARPFDSGPYEPGNVYITTLRDNSTQIRPNLALKRAALSASQPSEVAA